MYYVLKEFKMKYSIVMVLITNLVQISAFLQLVVDQNHLTSAC